MFIDYTTTATSSNEMDVSIIGYIDICTIGGVYRSCEVYSRCSVFHGANCAGYIVMASLCSIEIWFVIVHCVRCVSKICSEKPQNIARMIERQNNYLTKMCVCGGGGGKITKWHNSATLILQPLFDHTCIV